MEKKDIMQSIVNYLKKNNVKQIGFFGSFARNEMAETSDVDVLVEYKRGTTLFDIVKMKTELNELIGKKVDLVDKNAVMPSVMKYIQKDLTIEYNA